VTKEGTEVFHEKEYLGGRTTKRKGKKEHLNKYEDLRDGRSLRGFGALRRFRPM
jgi:hypothetical protein